MVIHCDSSPARRRGFLMLDIVAALALLALALLPLAYAIASEARAARGYYQRAVAIEIVDGEMEVLIAGEWRAFDPGQHEIAVKSAAATNLPPGRFRLTREERMLRLEWLPAIKQNGGPVVREVALP